MKVPSAVDIDEGDLLAVNETVALDTECRAVAVPRLFEFVCDGDAV